jgi:hypothetical protein
MSPDVAVVSQPGKLPVTAEGLGRVATSAFWADVAGA